MVDQVLKRKKWNPDTKFFAAHALFLRYVPTFLLDLVWSFFPVNWAFDDDPSRPKAFRERRPGVPTDSWRRFAWEYCRERSIKQRIRKMWG